MGREVITAISVDVAIREITSHRVDVLMICGQISQKDETRLCEAFRRIRPKGKIVFIVADPPRLSNGCKANLVIGPYGPEAMVVAVTGKPLSPHA